MAHSAPRGERPCTVLTSVGISVHVVNSSLVSHLLGFNSDVVETLQRFRSWARWSRALSGTEGWSRTGKHWLCGALRWNNALNNFDDRAPVHS